MDAKSHWEHVYSAKPPTSVSWYQPEARLSLHMVARAAPDLAIPIIDVGGGASTLVDGLVDAGYTNVTVLDVAESALNIVRSRLAERATRVRWVLDNVLTASLPVRHFGVWHDRAVFHFLTDEQDRRRYVEQARQAIEPGGHIIVASFAPDGPQRCSGLEVVRYSPESMHEQFADGFQLLDSVTEEHHTPGGAIQSFVYCLCRVAE